MPEIALPPFLTHCLGIVLILHTCLIAVVAYAAVANLSKGDQKRFIRRAPFSCDAYVRGFSAFFLSALPPPVLSRSVAGLCRCGHVVSEPQRAAPPPPVLSPFLSRSVGEEGGQGEGEGRQACSTAQTLKPPGRRMRYPPTFP